MFRIKEKLRECLADAMRIIDPGSATILLILFIPADFCS